MRLSKDQGWAVGISVAALAALAYATVQAMVSPIYNVQVVELAFAQPPASGVYPVSGDEIRSLARVPVGKTSLYRLSLDEIQERLESHPWIRSAVLRKRFPQTLEIQVTFRRAVAQWVAPDRELRYVDEDGSLFGTLELGRGVDVPVLSGMPERALPKVVEFIKEWEKRELSRYAELAEVGWFADSGLRAVLLRRENAANSATGTSGRRLSLDMGQAFDDGMDLKLSRLSQVFEYARRAPMDLAAVRVGADKKIVVKTGRSS